MLTPLRFDDSCQSVQFARRIKYARLEASSMSCATPNPEGRFFVLFQFNVNRRKCVRTAANYCFNRLCQEQIIRSWHMLGGNLNVRKQLL